MGSRKVSILSLSGATLLTPELDSGNTIQDRADMLRTKNSVCFGKVERRHFCLAHLINFLLRSFSTSSKRRWMWHLAHSGCSSKARIVTVMSRTTVLHVARRRN